MFAIQVGLPEMKVGGKDPKAAKDERGFSGKGTPSRKPVPRKNQEFLSNQAGQEEPGTGSSQIDQILESISTMASSVSILQVQSDREPRLPQQRMRHMALLR